MTTTSLYNYPANYQLSTLGVGIIAAGIEDIRQSIGIILSTIKGTDPFRPLFGSDIYLHQDKPVLLAVPNVKKAIFDALELWEPRITVISITHTINVSQIIFQITYRTIDEVVDTVGYGLGSGIIDEGELPSNGIILTAVIPAKVTNGQYNVAFIVNGESVFPPPPTSGFTSVGDMYSWILANWGSFGRWYLSGSSLVLYMNPGIATSASLTVTQQVTIQVRRQIPNLIEGQEFALLLTLEGIEALPQFQTGINTVEGLYVWLLNNYGDYGTWMIQNGDVMITEGDFFSNDFSDEFDLGGVELNQTLIFETRLFTSADFSITARTV